MEVRDFNESFDNIVEVGGFESCRFSTSRLFHINKIVIYNCHDILNFILLYIPKVYVRDFGGFFDKAVEGCN